jgi:peptide deformylase
MKPLARRIIKEMAVREILLYSKHPAELRQKSKGVPFVNQKVLKLIRDLKDTLEASSDGIGLAAPQINIHKRVVIACLGEIVDGRWQAGPPVALINPEIVEASGERRDFDGCLSFPGSYGEMVRALVTV